MTLQKNGRNGCRGREEERLRCQAFFLVKERTVGVPFDSTYWLCDRETSHQCLFSHKYQRSIHRHLSWK